MKILILSCGTGGGHNTAGYAVAEEMRRRGHQVCFEDAFEIVGKPAAKIVNNTYIKTVQHAPKAFGAMYTISETMSKVPGESAVYWANSICTHALKKYLKDRSFDAIVMTHLFAAHMLTALRRRGVHIPPCYLIATDYTCYPFLKDARCDYVNIPSKELASTFIESGVHASKLLYFGIPVKCEFSHSITKEEACRAVGLSSKHDYILLSGGSIGASSMTSSIRALLTFLNEQPNAHLVVICGSNERLYEKLLHNFAGNKQLHIIGKTNQMPQYMHACRLFITKPGGLSTTEAAVSMTPTILMPPIPGCETYNIDFFRSHGMCIAIEDPETDLLPAIRTLFKTEAALDMQQAQRATINANSTRDLCDHIERHTVPSSHN